MNPMRQEWQMRSIIGSIDGQLLQAGGGGQLPPFRGALTPASRLRQRQTQRSAPPAENKFLYFAWQDPFRSHTRHPQSCVQRYLSR
jgi:hypothetical protein